MLPSNPSAREFPLAPYSGGNQQTIFKVFNRLKMTVFLRLRKPCAPYSLIRISKYE